MSPKEARQRAPARTPTSTPSAQNLLPFLSLLSSALPSSKSFSLCGWLGPRRNQSTPAALNRGLGVDFLKTKLKQTPVQPTDPNLAKWKSESGSFYGNSPIFAPP